MPAPSADETFPKMFLSPCKPACRGVASYSLAGLHANREASADASAAGIRTAKEVCVAAHIRLRGINGVGRGQTWESATLLRAGRLDSLEIALDDTSVSRYHAEIRITERGWRVRDLGSTNGTCLN